MQIPRRVRIAFREELVGWYLRAIDDLLQAEGFRPGPDNPAVSGERRSRVEQYYSAVDWNSPDETSRVLRVFEEVLAGTENSEGRQNLIAVLQRDGFEVDDSGRIRRPGSEEQAATVVLDRFAGEINGSIRTAIQDLGANFAEPTAQGPVAYAEQILLDHPVLDRTLVTADAVVAVTSFCEQVLS